MPRRSSTRASSTVSSPTRAAPGLNTELARYGSWPAVMIGFAAWRSKRAAASTSMVFTLGSRQPRGCPLMWRSPASCQPCVGSRGGRSTWDRTHDASRGPDLADALEGGQPHERRLRALVAVHAGGLEAVEAAARRRIGHRQADVVVAQEPAVGELDRVEIATIRPSARGRPRRPGSSRSPRSAAGRSGPAGRRAARIPRCRSPRTRRRSTSGRRSASRARAGPSR